MEDASPPSETNPSRGPVSDLEAHVPADWWHTLFGPEYLLTDADVLDDENTRQEVDRVTHLLGLSLDDHILDLCCGQGRHALELARRGFTQVKGLDSSGYLLDKARETASRESLEAAFCEGDSRMLPYADDTFNAVLLMGNSFGYFEHAEDDRTVLGEVRRVLKPAGQVLIDLTSGSYMRRHFEPRSWEWLDDDHFVCRERSLTDDGRRLVSREVITHVKKGVQTDQFYAERLYNRQELQDLLIQTGFRDVAFAGASSTTSTRNQDLGMMARRFMMTARPARSGSDDRRPSAPGRHVAVVMGDPSLPDETKRGDAFGEADFEVIDRLKEALDTLPDYHFTYLNDHHTLINDLQDLRGEADFVFNLCDEGFWNQPLQELHVPALLDMLGLPYSGAGPQCLAHCYDKSLVRGVARELGVPVAPACYLEAGQPVPSSFDLAFPVLVKPNAADSSIGITQNSVARTKQELAKAVASVQEQVGSDCPLLIEQFLTGKDLTVSLLGNPESELTVLPITEEDYSGLPEGLPPLCGYEAKWMPDSPYYMSTEKTRPAELPGSMRESLVAACKQLFARLACRDYARFDWRLDPDGRPYLLEVNPNPGWCWDGHMALQARHAGLNYPRFLCRILDATADRIDVTKHGGPPC